MSRTHLRKSWFALLLIAAAAHTAFAQDIRLNILKQDDNVFRKMVVLKTSGERITSFVKINSFDRATGVFVVSDFTGETTSIPASDIQKIEFEQTTRELSPMAQQAHWEVRATPGSGLRYKVAQSDLSIESEDLVLPASSPASNIAAPTVPASGPPAHKGSVFTNVNAVEARSLTVDRRSKSFIIEVQNVRYTRETFGASGLSGIRK